MLTERATEVDASFALDDTTREAVAQLCRRLDHMPLAIELAAARLRSMTVGEIAERLQTTFGLLRGGARGVVERHRTLDAAVQWSYDLLDPAEQVVFQRLSVFVGGFSAGGRCGVR